MRAFGSRLKRWRAIACSTTLPTAASFTATKGLAGAPFLRKSPKRHAQASTIFSFAKKDLSAKALAALASDALAAIRDNLAPTRENPEVRARLLINSRTDVALAVGADGVHLRADDVTPAEVRHLLDVCGQRSPIAGDFLIAASCHSTADVVRAESEKADFAIFAPVFGKSGVNATRPAGLEALREACRARGCRCSLSAA